MVPRRHRLNWIAGCQTNPTNFKELRHIINDENIAIEKIMGFTPATSRTDTPLFKAIKKIANERLGARLVPTVAGGFTDSHFFETWVSPVTATRPSCSKHRRPREFMATTSVLASATSPTVSKFLPAARRIYRSAAVTCPVIEEVPMNVIDSSYDFSAMHRVCSSTLIKISLLLRNGRL